MGFDNIHNNRWTGDEQAKLVNIMIDNEFDYHNAPWAEIASMFEGRTAKSIQAKVGRLLKSDPNVFENKRYEWPASEVKVAVRHYLDGESYARIHERLAEAGCKASMKELEGKLRQMRTAIAKELHTYAEERGLEVKRVTPDLLQFFLKNKNTTSQLVRAGLHSRIING